MFHIMCAALTSDLLHILLPSSSVSAAVSGGDPHKKKGGGLVSLYENIVADGKLTGAG